MATVEAHPGNAVEEGQEVYSNLKPDLDGAAFDADVSYWVGEVKIDEARNAAKTVASLSPANAEGLRETGHEYGKLFSDFLNGKKVAASAAPEEITVESLSAG